MDGVVTTSNLLEETILVNHLQSFIDCRVDNADVGFLDVNEGNPASVTTTHVNPLRVR